MFAYRKEPTRWLEKNGSQVRRNQFSPLLIPGLRRRTRFLKQRFPERKELEWQY